MFAVFLKTGAQETPASSGGGKRYPVEQHPDLTQGALPKRYGRGMNTHRRRPCYWQMTVSAGAGNPAYFSRPCRYLRWRQRPESRTSSTTLPRSWVWPQRKATAFLSKHIIRFAWIFFSRSIFATRIISILMNTPTCVTVGSLSGSQYDWNRLLLW